MEEKELSINGADAYIALMRAIKEEMKFASMFANSDSFVLLFADFNRNLQKKGYSDEDINDFHEQVTKKILTNEIE